jgi:hypothetical protein
MKKHAAPQKHNTGIHPQHWKTKIFIYSRKETRKITVFKDMKINITFKGEHNTKK